MLEAISQGRDKIGFPVIGRRHSGGMKAVDDGGYCDHICLLSKELISGMIELWQFQNFYIGLV